MEHGRDEEYTKLGEAAQEGWRRWNTAWGETLYHETGLLALSRGPFAAGGYEHESFQTLLKRGHRPERLRPEQVDARFPAWRTADYADAFYHAKGGYTESGCVVSRLADLARREDPFEVVRDDVGSQTFAPENAPTTRDGGRPDKVLPRMGEHPLYFLTCRLGGVLARPTWT